VSDLTQYLLKRPSTMHTILRNTYFILLLVFAVPNLAHAEAVTHNPFSDYCLKKLKRPSENRLNKEVRTDRNTVIIVDGYSSGRFFAQAFRDEGMQVVHVHSKGAPPKASFAKTFWPESFDLDIKHDGNLPKLLEQLRGLKIVTVLPGADSGVIFSDELIAALHKEKVQLPSNGIDRARKDKYLMAERLRDLGIDAVKQMKTNNHTAAIEWVRANQLFSRGPRTVVIKPILSGGSDGLFFAKSEEEIKMAFAQILGHPDEIGNMNHEVLVQEFLEGEEYVINTTSRDGKHVVTDMWKYTKRLTPDGFKLIYDFDELLPFNGDLQKELIAYNNKVLAALKIFHGNGHSEVKMVPGRGPVLIEMNTRMMGSSQPVLAEIALGHSQIDRTVLAMNHPEEFRKLAIGYEFKNHAAMVTLANFKGAGARLNPAVHDKIRALPGYVYHSLSYADNEAVGHTDDLGSAVGDIWLVHADRKVLLESIAELHRMEQDGTLVIAP
jgi:biotin carboxylase